jgi:predicted enzyme related to lactoylglutathione lyase
VSGHRSRLVHFVIDVNDLDDGVDFWRAALGATEEQVNAGSEHVYRRLRVSGSNVRVLLQLVDDPKGTKERMHLDIETDDVDAEVKRLEAIGAVRRDHQTARGYDFWVMQDPWGNEFCVLETAFPDLLAETPPWEDPTE